MGKKDRAKREIWNKKVAEWKRSGLSVQKWCLQNNENYYRFCYWKQTLNKDDRPLAFQELKEEEDLLDIELRFGDVIISFPKGCRAELLELCLRSLRKAQC